ncbi:amidase family protein [Pseudooceanicola sp.]|uniref:amidase n=1 Tax=Pseudooceanicola sp. TaxID=1914328 RepID=UPI00262358EC|nr:amidase family protein [Pseudooceanicola sp.]MDF1854595.1 amidase family protein [Pseudooceanicola sp.]
MDKWLWMSAGELGRGIGAGEIDPVALCDTYLAAIDAHPDTPRIYARVTHDRARAEARDAAERARLGLRRGPLDGVPVSWKDLFDSAGVATEAGSALLQGRVPDRDAQVLANATAMGLVCLGKTHMSELAFSGIGLNPITATPPNRNDATAVPGGSSSGAAASVAFGLAAAGLGSDTGGSVRIPAAWNDLVGLKTTSGRVPLDGVVPLAKAFDTIGPLCRNVEDCALTLAAIEGGRPADLRGATLDGIRFAALDTLVLDDIRDAPLSGFRSARERLQRAGALVTPVEAPELAQANDLSGILFTSEAYGLWKADIEAAPEKMFPEILSRFRSGADYAAADYVAAWELLHHYRRIFLARMASYDAVICPTAPILPPNAERMLADHEYYVAENLLALRNTRVGNLMGLCALTLPTGVPSCGLMILARPGSEEALLRLGAAAEKALS